MFGFAHSCTPKSPDGPCRVPTSQPRDHPATWRKSWAVADAAAATADTALSKDHFSFMPCFFSLGHNLTQLWKVIGHIFAKSVIFQIYKSISQKLLAVAKNTFTSVLPVQFWTEWRSMTVYWSNICETFRGCAMSSDSHNWGHPLGLITLLFKRARLAIVN